MRRELLNALDPRLGIRAADTKVFFIHLIAGF